MSLSFSLLLPSLSRSLKWKEKKKKNGRSNKSCFAFLLPSSFSSSSFFFILIFFSRIIIISLFSLSAAAVSPYTPQFMRLFALENKCTKSHLRDSWNIKCEEVLCARAHKQCRMNVVNRVTSKKFLSTVKIRVKLLEPRLNNLQSHKRWLDLTNHII